MSESEFNEIENIKWSKVGYLSIFDHWLNEIEADNCNYLNYSIAQSSDNLYLYLKGEENFINFYTSLSSQALCFYKDSWKLFNTDSDDFKNIIKDSLREKNLKFFDIYYSKYSLRVKGGYDRTDQFFIEDSNFLSELTKIIEDNELHVLGVQDYAEFLKDI